MRYPSFSAKSVLLIVLFAVAEIFAFNSPENPQPAKVSRPTYVHDGATIASIRNSAAWQQFQARYNCRTEVVWNVGSGTPHRVVTSGIDLASALNEDNVAEISAKFIDDNRILFGVNSADLKLQTAGFHGRMWYVIFDRYYRGLPVYNGRVNLTYSAAGRLVSFGSDAYPKINIDTQPTINRDRALQVIHDFVNPESGKHSVESEQLLVLPFESDGTVSFHLAWKMVYYMPDEPARWFIFVDAHSGEILMYWDAIMYAFSGNVNGDVQLDGAYEPFYNNPFKDLTVTASGYGSAETDENGDYSIPGSGTATITAELKGPFLDVDNDQSPGDASFSSSSSGSLDIDWTDISHAAERDAYYHSMIVHDYINYVDPDYTGMDWQVGCIVNIDEACNASWNGSSINFFREQGGCGNTGQMSTVIYHEYGHGITEYLYYPVDLPYSYETGGLNEGWSDFIANCITDQPLEGRGWYGYSGSYLRSSDNDATAPPDCYPYWDGEPHCWGYVMAGALWDMRVNLINANGDGIKPYVDSLWHYARYAKPTSFDDYLWELLLYDDDDDDPLNGTPNYESICDGFGQHGIECPALTLLQFTYPFGLPESINPAGGSSVRVEVTPIYSTPEPGTGRIYYNDGSGWVDVAMSQLSPNVYDAIFPAFACDTEIQFYFSAETEGAVVATDPPDAPSNTYSTISAYGLQVLYQDDFSTNQGWTGLGGAAEWSIGAATGGSGDDSYGGPDPAADHSPGTDNQLLGNDLGSGLGGDYDFFVPDTGWVTSPVIDCSGYSNITLSFYRWLGIEQNQYDNVCLDVYDGANWVRLFENDNITIDESVWTKWSFDVSAWADGNSNFQVRFGLGPTDVAWQYCGWNIDDLKVASVDCNTPEQIPTLSQWGMILLSLLLIAAATAAIVRRYRAPIAESRLRG